MFSSTWKLRIIKWKKLEEFSRKIEGSVLKTILEKNWKKSKFSKKNFLNNTWSNYSKLRVIRMFALSELFLKGPIEFGLRGVYFTWKKSEIIFERIFLRTRKNIFSEFSQNYFYCDFSSLANHARVHTVPSVSSTSPWPISSRRARHWTPRQPVSCRYGRPTANQRAAMQRWWGPIATRLAKRYPRLPHSRTNSGVSWEKSLPHSIPNSF